MEAVQEGKVICDHNKCKQIVTVSICLKKELLDYAWRNGILSGPVFLTRDGRPVHRTYVSAAIRNLCKEVGIPRREGKPQVPVQAVSVHQGGRVESSISLLVEQAMEQMLEQEQFSVG